MTIDNVETNVGCSDATNHKTELIAFDFDETIVNCNSDTFINQLAPNSKIPEEIWNRFLDERDWTAYMQQVFVYLHQNGIKEIDYDHCLRSMPLLDGMKELFDFICKHQNYGNIRYEAIIISDANTYFIGNFLRSLKIDSIFKKIYTNPAYFDSEGCLQIQRYQVQDFCKLSAINMCKGHILKEFINQRQSNGFEYSKINYIGDGQNDFCPSLTLKSGDRIFPRSGFKLHQCIKSSAAIKADVYPFVTGHDIQQVLSLF